MTQESAPQLGRAYTIGLCVVGGVYVLLALVLAIANATSPRGSGNLDIDAAVVRGQIVGYFACCSILPLILAAVVAGGMLLAGRKTSWVTSTAKVVFWLLLALIPFQLVTLLIALAGLLKP